MALRTAGRFAACAAALAGAAFRLVDFGRYGFWNDEAWVAIATRVAGVRQFLLALSVTPIAWGALLLPAAWLPAPPEISLRLLPLGFSLLTLWLAWCLGTRLAGNELGGLLALALVACDPTTIAWSAQLKPYTAEAALALIAFLAADRVVRRRGTADVVRLALVLTLGTTLSNAQLPIAPPLLAVLAGRALVRRDPTLRPLLLAGVVVGLWNIVWFTLVIHPWLTPSLRDYWRAYYAPISSAAALGEFAWRTFALSLMPALGTHAITLALGGLALLLAERDRRWAGLAVLLLVAELVGLSVAGIFPLGVPRAALFASTLLLVTTGAAAGRLVSELWTVRALRPLAAATAVLLVVDVAWHHEPLQVQRLPAEDLGPLVRTVEAERRAGDHIVLYGRSLFVWGFYRTGTPVLQATPALANGYFVWVDDPDVFMVHAGDIDGPVAHAFDGAARVWFVGSRFGAGDEVAIGQALTKRGHVVREEHRDGALLLLLEPR
jgi:hypothetical protein